MSLLAAVFPVVAACGADEAPLPRGTRCAVNLECPTGQICNGGTCSFRRQWPAPDGTAPDPDLYGSPGSDGGVGPSRLDGSAARCPEAVSCHDLNANCGVFRDGCNGYIDCGTCQAPETCGGGGEPNRCGTGDGSCTPATCHGLGIVCGDLGNGCGGKLSCGSCPDGQVCDNGRCTCTPQTCADLGASCGDPEDGCGNRLDCGACTAPETCGGGGDDYQCGCEGRPVATEFKPFKRARNVSAGPGTVAWRDVTTAGRLDGLGASIETRGYCKWEGVGGSNDGCGCCTRIERRTATSQYLLLDDADLAVPDGAKVLGVEVELTARRLGEGPTLNEIALVGPTVSDDRARAITMGTSFQPLTFGGPTDRWYQTWSPAELRATEFGVRIQMTVSGTCINFGGNHCPRTATVLDGARVRVWYESCL